MALPHHDLSMPPGLYERLRRFAHDYQRDISALAGVAHGTVTPQQALVMLTQLSTALSAEMTLLLGALAYRSPRIAAHVRIADLPAYLAAPPMADLTGLGVVIGAPGARLPKVRAPLRRAGWRIKIATTPGDVLDLWSPDAYPIILLAPPADRAEAWWHTVLSGLDDQREASPRLLIDILPEEARSSATPRLSGGGLKKSQC